MEVQVRRFVRRGAEYLAGAVAAFILASAAFGTMSKSSPVGQYGDLGGEPARYVHSCINENAFYRVLASLERTESLRDVASLFSDGTCVFLKGFPVDPAELASDRFTHVLTTDDYEGQPVYVYQVQVQGTTAWVAVWFSVDYTERL